MAYSLTCSQLCDIYYITRRRFYSASQFSFLSIHGELNAWLCSFKNVIFLLQKFVLASWLWFSFNSFVKACLIYIFFKTFVRFYYNTLFDKRKANKKKNLMCFLRASNKSITQTFWKTKFKLFITKTLFFLKFLLGLKNNFHSHKKRQAFYAPGVSLSGVLLSARLFSTFWQHRRAWRRCCSSAPRSRPWGRPVCFPCVPAKTSSALPGSRNL